MEKVAFRIGNFEVMWYALIIMMGVVLGLIVVNFNIRKRKDLKLSFDDFTDAFIWAFPLAIIGARLYYVIFEWKYYQGNLREILNLRGGGLAIHGGIIGAVIGVLLYKRFAKKSGRYILDLADAAAPAMILAQAVGRWGNFINQEAHGGEVSREFMQNFPRFIYDGMFIRGKFYHPTFLYEFLWNLLVFFILMFLFMRRKKHKSGFVLAYYLILYSLGRFLIEGMRTDSLMLGGIRVAQLISVLMMLLGAYMLFRIRNTKSIEEDETVVITPDEPAEVITKDESVSEVPEKKSLKDSILHGTKKDTVDTELKTSEPVDKDVTVETPVTEKKDEIKEKTSDFSERLKRASEDYKEKDRTLDTETLEENKGQRKSKKGVVQAKGELVEPVTEKKVSLKEKLKASREKSKERVKSIDRDIKDNEERPQL